MTEHVREESPLLKARIVNLRWFDSPMSVFEIALSFWLLFKGPRRFVRAEPDPARAGAA
jgi:hypothetical protein